MGPRVLGPSARAIAAAAMLVAGLLPSAGCRAPGPVSGTPSGEHGATTAPAVHRESPVALGPGAVHARVGPAVAFVETPLGTGSAVLVQPGVLLTNAHVVWPEETVRVAFSDGSEHASAPVTHVDLMADLAVIDVRPSGGPPAGVEPVEIADGSALPIGSDVFLVGYPGEADAFPQPALARGIVSLHRHQAALALRYIQTDAAIGGGQSGGALVDANGAVVGFSSMTFGDAAFALALSAPDAMDRVARLLGGEDVDGLAERRMPVSTHRSRVHRVDLASPWDEAVFVLWPAFGDIVEVRATSRSDAALEVLDPYGELLASVDDTAGGDERAETTVETAGPVFVVTYLDGAGAVDVRATAPLARFVDPDDGRDLGAGGSIAGALDFPGDIDHFYLELPRGTEVNVRIDTVSFVPDALLEPVEAADPAPRFAPKLTGPLGLTLEVVIAAGRGGRHVLTVRDLDGVGTGGYGVSWRP